MRILSAALCLLALPLLAPRAAQAQQLHTSRPPGVQIGAEAGLAFTLGDTGKGLDAVGYDFIGRVGYEFAIGLPPQLVVEYATFSVSNTSLSQGALEIMPGLRWAVLAGTYRPWAAFNIGFGHSFPAAGDSQNGLAYNLGGGVDFYVT